MGIRYVLRASRCIPILLLALAQTVSPTLVAQEMSTTFVATAQAWLDAQLDVVAGTHTLSPLDARVQIPNCSSGFEFSLPHPGNKTVLASCPGIDWSLYLQVRETVDNAVPVFASDLPAGHLLGVADIRMDVGAARENEALLLAVTGKFLRSGVRAGQPVNQSVLEDAVPAFRVRRPVDAGADLDRAMFDEILRPVSALPPARQVTVGHLAGARSARALPAGTVITLADISSRQAVLTAAGTIARGTLLSSDNTVMGYHWGRLPHDVILDPAGLPRATTTSTLFPGQVLRLSALRSLPPVAKGDTVTLSVKRNLVEISQVTTALQDGQIGQQIDLINSESGGRIRATVTGVGTASIP
jgi:flagella basal body P-ring formation protein FlgA